MKILSNSIPISLLLITLLFACKEYGDLLTNPKPIRLTTKVAEEITATTALSGGNISNDGGTAIIQRGVVWSASRNPTISLSTKTVDGMGSGSFTSSITGLMPGTTYFVRAYATNREGTEYGNEISIITESNLPTLTTLPVTEIRTTSIVSGGVISKDGGLPVIARGVVWSTSGNPTISLSSKTADGSGIGNFISTITGLSPGTRYFLRAYATNSAGTSYGEEIKFETDASWIELDNVMADQMKLFEIPGMSVAIIRNEKLVYLKSYGYSDKEENRTAQNDDLYRIADISKLLTWIATMRLDPEWGTGQDERVFGSNSILGKDFVSPPANSGKDILTIRHFLDHTSGWTNSPFDPMFEKNTLTQSEIINDLLINRPLTYIPGTTPYEFNAGYCVLGRVIEKVTNVTYEQYVKSVLNQLSITNIKIGGNSLNERFTPYEVKYYQNGSNPYDLNIKRMDAHAGWIASAKDLARIMVRIDGNLNVPDFITYKPLQQALPATNWVQYGTMPGTSSILHRLNDTYSFVVLCNTQWESDPLLLLNSLDNSITEQIKSRPSWPSYDLF